MGLCAEPVRLNLKFGKANSVRSLPRDLQPLRRKDGAVFRDRGDPDRHLGATDGGAVVAIRFPAPRADGTVAGGRGVSRQIDCPGVADAPIEGRGRVRNGVENAEQIRAGSAHHGHVVNKDDIRRLVGRLEGCPHETISKIDDRDRRPRASPSANSPRAGPIPEDQRDATGAPRSSRSPAPPSREAERRRGRARGRDRQERTSGS